MNYVKNELAEQFTTNLCSEINVSDKLFRLPNYTIIKTSDIQMININIKQNINGTRSYVSFEILIKNQQKLQEILIPIPDELLLTNIIKHHILESINDKLTSRWIIGLIN